MQDLTRFGRKLPLPSAVGLADERRLVAAADSLAPAETEGFQSNTMSDAQLVAFVGDLATKHGLSVDRAQMLVDRFGIGQHSLDGAARGVGEWKN